MDTSGAPLPQCTITARNLDGANQETAYCGIQGEFHFDSIPPGRYVVEVSASAMAHFSAEVPVTADGAARLEPRLEIAPFSDRIRVTADRPPGAPRRQSVALRGIHVGGNVQPPKQLSRTEPKYPPELILEEIHGEVFIRAVISTTGAVLSPTVLNTVDPRLARAALDAVSEWQYSLALLNGEPVEVSIVITVDFTLI